VAQDLLERCNSSQGGLDAELVQKLALCETVRQSARESEQRFKSDLTRFKTMKVRLLEAAGAAPSVETLQLLAEDDATIERCEESIQIIGKLAKEGVRPSLASVPSTPTSPESFGAGLSPSCVGGR